MKKIVLFLVLLHNSILLSQTVLNSFPLNLSNPLENGQSLNIEDVKTNEIYVFASDNSNINILKYNKSLFLRGQFTDSIKSAKNGILLGSSLSEDGNPSLYWSSPDYKNLKIIKYYFDTKASKTLSFDFGSYNSYVISHFQKDNSFYVLAKEIKEPHLLLFIFNNGKCEIKMFDFSGILFQNKNDQRFSFSTILQYFPIEKMEHDNFNPLDKSVSKNKMYVLDNHILLTLDYNTKKTQVLDLNLETQEVTEKNYDQPISKKPSKTSNSFYNDNKLFQISTNNDEFLFDVKDLSTGKSVKTVSISKKDTINFKNSPLFIQNNGYKPQEINTTAKFLKQLSALNVGVTVFKNKENSFITFGGFLEYQISRAPSFNYSQNDAFFGFEDYNAYPAYTQSRMVYFDSMMNPDYEFINNQQTEPLAIDNIFYFLGKSKNIILENIIKLKDYSLLGYYDLGTKQYVIRKFTDGFTREDAGNPISNKAVFSKNFPVNKP